MSDKKKYKRTLVNEDILRYEAMVEKFIRNNCMKNWTESKHCDPDSFLGTSGYSLNDLRQQLRTEVCVALHNYDPNYKTKDGRSVKESTFVYQHLTFRVGQLMKRLTKRRMGYGIYHSQFESILKSGVEEESILDVDLVTAIDIRDDIEGKSKSQVDKFLKI